MRLEGLAEYCRRYTGEAAEFIHGMEVRPEILTVADDAAERILTAGAKYQISDNEQSFERLDTAALLVGLREELLDVVNYVAMLDILTLRELDAEWERIVAAGPWRPTEEDYDGPDTPERERLFRLRADLHWWAAQAAYSAASIDKHLAATCPASGASFETLLAEAQAPVCPECGEAACLMDAA